MNRLTRAQVLPERGRVFFELCEIRMIERLLDARAYEVEGRVNERNRRQTPEPGYSVRQTPPLILPIGRICKPF